MMSTKDRASTVESVPATSTSAAESATPEPAPTTTRAASVLGSGRGGSSKNFAIGVSGRTRRRPTA
ncbi:hypothetical protein ACI2K4_10770 [Micromonospora sp. NPDC050397]|uniref:hypothetical protein n=1 Tax=Micromonospora sp. NPDC050397 TaxID=3364279 RepID=UPI00384B8790